MTIKRVTADKKTDKAASGKKTPIKGVSAETEDKAGKPPAASLSGRLLR